MSGRLAARTARRRVKRQVFSSAPPPRPALLAGRGLVRAALLVQARHVDDQAPILVPQGRRAQNADQFVELRKLVRRGLDAEGAQLGIWVKMLPI